jgi:hypothetical protein
MKKNQLLILATVFAIGCSTRDLEPKCIQNGDISKAYSLLQGKWSWRKTFAQYRGQPEPYIQTPETENKRKTFIFQNSLMYEFRRNDTLIAKGNYELIKSNTNGIYLKLSPENGTGSVKSISLCTNELITQQSPDATSTYSKEE